MKQFSAALDRARMMFPGIISGAQAFALGELSFNIVRVLLGIAELGFPPASSSI
jgi:hypothetical protein